MLRSEPPRGTCMETLETTVADFREFTDLSSPDEQDEWLAERVPHEVITWTAWELRGGTNGPVTCRVRYMRPVAVSCEVSDDPQDTEKDVGARHND